MTPPLALALDTSTPTLSCALLALEPTGIRLLGTREVPPPAIVSTLVPGLFEELLGEAGATVADVGVVVSGVGPGLFTGARVAVATMKAIAYARRLPLLGAGSLEAMSLAAARGGPLATGEALAYDTRLASGWLCPVIDARKGEVYFAVYRWQNGQLDTLSPPQAAPPSAVVEMLRASVGSPRPFGAGLTALGAGWEGAAPFTPGAAEIGYLALMRDRAPAFDLAQVLALEPTYIRPPEAEVARQRRALAKAME